MNEKEWKAFQEKVKKEDEKNIGVGIYTKTLIIKVKHENNLFPIRELN